VRRDPDAARTSFAELSPHLVGLEASSNTLPRREVEVMLEGPDPASRLLLSYYRAYRERSSWLQGPEESPLTLFDAITLLSLVSPEAFDFQQLSVLVERDGRLRLTDDGSPVTYALSSEWSALEPMLAGLLSGDGS
jgi:inosine-uridine nucleoside N-ribohydrolase